MNRSLPKQSYNCIYNKIFDANPTIWTMKSSLNETLRINITIQIKMILKRPICTKDLSEEQCKPRKERNMESSNYKTRPTRKMLIGG